MSKPDLLALRPADTPDYMTEAWLSCLYWAIGVPEIEARFRKDTGMRWKPGRTGIERMIDEATGMEWEYFKAFTLWANVHVWGPLDLAPDAPPREQA